MASSHQLGWLFLKTQNKMETTNCCQGCGEIGTLMHC